jgi:hypothetical protein
MSTATTTPALQLGGMRRLGAAFVLLVSLAGLGVSCYLTVLKFRMAYTPCLTARGGCNIGGLTCEDALNSSWSMLLGLPISPVGRRVLPGDRRARGRPAAPRRLPARRGPAAAVRSSPVRRARQRAPGDLRVRRAALAVPVLHLAVRRQRPAARRRAGAAPRPRQRRPTRRAGSRCARQIALLDAALHGRGRLRDRGRRAVGRSTSCRGGSSTRRVGCPEPVKSLPPATIKSGSTTPKAIVAMFIDLTCSHCKAEFKVVLSALTRRPVPRADAAVDLPHAAPGLRSGGVPGRLRQVGRQRPLRQRLPGGARRRVHGEAAARRRHRADRRHVRAARRPRANVPLFTAERIGNQAVELEMQIDPDDPDNKLFKCINEDKGVIAEHHRAPALRRGPEVQGPHRRRVPRRRRPARHDAQALLRWTRTRRWRRSPSTSASRPTRPVSPEPRMHSEFDTSTKLLFVLTGFMAIMVGLIAYVAGVPQPDPLLDPGKAPARGRQARDPRGRALRRHQPRRPRLPRRQVLQLRRLRPDHPVQPVRRGRELPRLRVRGAACCATTSAA